MNAVSKPHFNVYAASGTIGGLDAVHAWPIRSAMAKVRFRMVVGVITAVDWKQFTQDIAHNTIR